MKGSKMNHSIHGLIFARTGETPDQRFQREIDLSLYCRLDHEIQILKRAAPLSSVGYSQLRSAQKQKAELEEKYGTV